MHLPCNGKLNNFESTTRKPRASHRLIHCFPHICISHPFVLYAPLTGGSSLSLGLGQLWQNLDPFRLLALPFGIAVHLQIVLLYYHPIFLLPYHFLKLVSFLGANRTRSASVGPQLL